MTDTKIDSRPHADQFTNLLAVCDGSEGDTATLRIAADMAKESRGRVSVLGFFTRPHELTQLARYTQRQPDDILSVLADRARQRLQQFVSDAGIVPDAQIRICTGKLFIEVIREVVEQNHDLVVKACTTSVGGPRSLFASTDQHLLRKCPVPVWLHMPETPHPARTILAAVDVELDNPDMQSDQQKLNLTTLRTAMTIASAQGAALHVLNAWNAPGESMIWMWSDAPDPKAEVDAYLQAIAEQSHQAMTHLVSRLGPESGQIRLHALRGPARETIPQTVGKLGADILVMGSIARTGVPGLIIGNTAEDVLNRVECSVIVVKPPGYESPVRF